MQYLFLLLVLAACGKAEAEKKILSLATKSPENVEEKIIRQFYSNIIIAAEGEFTKYFHHEELFPYITIRDGYWKSVSYDEKIKTYRETNYALHFKNRGKVLVYTNRYGGLKINDEEILLGPEELTNILHRAPILNDIDRQRYQEMRFLYTRFYTDFFIQFSKPKHIWGILNQAFVPEKERIYFSSEKPYYAVDSFWTFMDQFSPIKSLFLMQISNIANPKDKEQFKYYYQDWEKKIPLDIPLGYNPEYVYLLNVLPRDDLYKFYRSMLNLFFLHIQRYDHTLGLDPNYLHIFHGGKAGIADPRVYDEPL